LRPPPSPTLFPYTTLFRSQFHQVDRERRGIAGDPAHGGFPSGQARRKRHHPLRRDAGVLGVPAVVIDAEPKAVHDDGVAFLEARDRKSTRLNSSHVKISYA